MAKTTTIPILATGAIFSHCERYRYDLYRWLDMGEFASGEIVTFVMLNPSTADAYQEDPTVRRCLGFAHAWGYEHVHVVNIFALRSTDPRALKRADDPVGPLNDHYIRQRTRPDRVSRVVLAWGGNGTLMGRGAGVLRNILEWRRGRDIYRLGPANKDGTPQHPLYLPNTVKPESVEAP